MNCFFFGVATSRGLGGGAEDAQVRLDSLQKVAARPVLRKSIQWYTSGRTSSQIKVFWILR